MHRSVVRTLSRTAAAQALSVATLSCSDDEATGPPDLSVPVCTTTVALTVSPGTTPTFNWAPACRLFSLGVEPVNTGLDLWVIVSSNNTNSIAPPVVYGQIPAGAVQTGDPIALEEDVGYQVVVIALSADDQVLAGSEFFNP